MRMTRAAIARDASKLRFGNADRLLTDRPTDRHSLPLIRTRLRRSRIGAVLTHGSKDEVYCGVRKRSEEHTSELQSRGHLVCRLLLEKKKKKIHIRIKVLKK